MNRTLSAVVLLAFGAVAPAADKIDNPEYKNWSKFKPGTSVVMKMTAEKDGLKVDTTATTTLVEVKGDEVVLETETVYKANGQEVKTPAERRNVPKVFDKSPPGLDPKTGKPDGTTDEGKEKIKVGGKEYETKWYKVKQKTKGLSGVEEETEGQVWISEDVPGQTVKVVMKLKAGSMTTELADVTIKK